MQIRVSIGEVKDLRCESLTYNSPDRLGIELRGSARVKTGAKVSLTIAIISKGAEALSCLDAEIIEVTVYGKRTYLICKII